MNTDYKQKALKYKIKYLELKKKMNKQEIIGGKIPEWYDKFESELYEIYNSINNNYPDVILTGSGAIAYLLKQLEMEDELENFKPGDLDLIYRSRTRVLNPTTIRTTFGNYEIKSGQENESSVTFISNDKNSSNFIKSFDVSKVPDVKSFSLNGIEIINLNRLKFDYVPDFTTEEERKEKDLYKISLIEKIIYKIGTKHRLDEFGLGDNITRRDPKRKSTSAGLFGDDSDDDTDIFMNNNFGYDISTPKKTKLTGLFDDYPDSDSEVDEKS